MNITRVGIGYDIHRLKEGRKLILGGVQIQFGKGLEGHSDGDCVIHAIIDAMLGAASLGDIGSHFPDTDPAYKDADSRHLLRNVIGMIEKEGFSVVNIDATIIAEKPKLNQSVGNMKNNIAGDAGISPDSVSIKATTNEGLGPVGEGEGIAALAVVLLSK